MKLYLHRTEPVQEVAAEPATLAVFKTALSPHAQPLPATPALTPAAQLIGWPLIEDPGVAPGLVHLRPRPDRTLAEEQQ